MCGRLSPNSVMGMSWPRTNVLGLAIGIQAVRHAELALTMHKSGTLMRGSSMNLPSNKSQTYARFRCRRWHPGIGGGSAR